MNKYLVYEHVNKITKKRYIGCTSKKTLIERTRKDGSAYKDNKKFWEDIVKYGWDNFEHNILYYGKTQEEAYELEKQLIAKYDTVNNGYNRVISHGGAVKGRKYTKQRNDKLRISKLCNTAVKGRIYVNKDNIEKMIYKEDLEYYLNQGFSLGSSEKHKKSCSIGSSGKLWINNNVLEKLVHRSEYEYYLKLGYVKGRLKNG